MCMSVYSTYNYETPHSLSNFKYYIYVPLPCVCNFTRDISYFKDSIIIEAFKDINNKTFLNQTWENCVSIIQRTSRYI